MRESEAACVPCWPEAVFFFLFWWANREKWLPIYVSVLQILIFWAFCFSLLLTFGHTYSCNIMPRGRNGKGMTQFSIYFHMHKSCKEESKHLLSEEVKASGAVFELSKCLCSCLCLQMTDSALFPAWKSRKNWTEMFLEVAELSVLVSSSGITGSKYIWLHFRNVTW